MCGNPLNPIALRSADPPVGSQTRRGGDWLLVQLPWLPSPTSDAHPLRGRSDAGLEPLDAVRAFGHLDRAFIEPRCARPYFQSADVIDIQTGNVETMASACDEDWRNVMADTGSETLTGTRIKRAMRYAEGNLFLATYGDGVSDVDLDALAAIWFMYMDW